MEVGPHEALYEQWTNPVIENSVHVINSVQRTFVRGSSRQLPSLRHFHRQSTGAGIGAGIGAAHGWARKEPAQSHVA